MIVAGISSMAKRHAALIDAVDSLTPQVDRVHVYVQPGHRAKKSNFADRDKVEIITTDHYGEDMGDAGKFFRAGDYEDAYYLSCDDDLVYPSNYAETVVNAIDEYGGRVIVGFHGVLMKKNPTHYYRDREVFHGLGDLEYARFVHVIGTCSAGYRTKYVPFTYKDLKSPNIADIWISLFAQQHKIPVVCLPHHKGWIKHTEKIDLKETLHSGFHRDLNYPGNKYIRRNWQVFELKNA